MNSCCCATNIAQVDKATVVTGLTAQVGRAAVVSVQSILSMLTAYPRWDILHTTEVKVDSAVGVPTGQTRWDVLQ